MRQFPTYRSNNSLVSPTLPVDAKKFSKSFASPVSVASTKLFSVASLSNTPTAAGTWKGDARLVKSKVFRARFESSVTRIQSCVRRHQKRETLDKLRVARDRHIQRKRRCAASIKIQAIVRGIIGRKLFASHLAARVIQGGARGFISRRHLPVLVLEKQLRDVEARRRKELREIQIWKNEIIIEYFRNREEERQASTERNQQWEQLTTEMKTLRKGNRKLREKNDALREEGVAIRNQNKKLTRKIKEERKLIKKYKAIEKTTEEDILKGVEAVKLMKGQCDDYKRAIGKHEEFHNSEKRLSNLHLATLSRIVENVQAKCRDKKLVTEVMSLALLEG